MANTHAWEFYEKKVCEWCSDPYKKNLVEYTFIVTFNHAGIITFINEKLATFLNDEPVKLIGTNLNDLFYGPFKEEFDSILTTNKHQNHW